MRRQGPQGVARPRPPLTSAPRKDAKRFTVRDGFHLKDRNDEKRDEIDHAIATDGIVHAPPNQTTDVEVAPVNAQGAPPLHHRASCVDTEVAMIFDFLQRPPPAFSADTAPPKTPNSPSTPVVDDSIVAIAEAQRQAEAAAIVARLGPSADWLIYRRRTNATPRRKEEQLEQMIHAVLSAKEDEILRPTAPDAAITKVRRSHRRHRQHMDSLLNRSRSGYIDGTVVAPNVPPETTRVASPTRTTTPLLSTQRSRMREKSAVPIKTEKLLGRLHELRTFPAIVERVLQLDRDKREEMFEQHGENLIAKNKTLHRLMPPLQRPVHTPVFPSLVEHKQRQASLRKQLVEEHQASSLKQVVNRWQNRRMQIQQHERTHYVQSQWLLITCLGQATAAWARQFRACKARRDLIFRLAMIKKIQRYWRQKQFVRKNKRAVLGMPADSPLRSQFFRMPTVLKAIRVVQAGMQRWLARKKLRANKRAVEIIITSWLEFQDVKFRRLILRFRKRVREFQTRWRTWRAITDARIKLLLLVWAKVERKHKRRGGLATPADHHGDSTSPHKQQQQLRTTSSELIHRHLRNGGMVLTAVSALGGAVLGGAADSKPTPRNSPPKRGKPELALRQNVEDDLQFAMRDFYSTTTRSPTNAHSRMSTSPVHHQSTGVLPRAGHHHGSQTLAKNPSAANIPPWKPLAGHAEEKIPHSLKVSLLRHLLSEKRKHFQATKERKRIEWKEKRQQLRQIDFRYNVLDELAAVQRFEAEHAVFLVLRSISEQEIMHLIQQAHQRLRVSTEPLGAPLHIEIPQMAIPGSPPSRRSITPNAPSASARKSRYEGPRRSTVLSLHSFSPSEQIASHER